MAVIFLVSVSVYSAHPDDITLRLNRGNALKVPGVGFDWKPTSPSGASFGFDNGGPSPNNFGPGSNTMQIQVGKAEIYSQPMTLPNSNPVALQLYLFADQSSASCVHYVLLYNGSVVATELTPLPASAS